MNPLIGGNFECSPLIGKNGGSQARSDIRSPGLNPLLSELWGMRIYILCVTRQLYENKDKTIKHFTPKQSFGEFFSIKHRSRFNEKKPQSSELQRNTAIRQVASSHL